METPPDPISIVVLGSSSAGLGAVHYLIKHVLPALPGSAIEAGTPAKYRVILVSPSTHFFWRVASPRLVADPAALPAGGKTCFIPIVETLTERYPVHIDDSVGALKVVLGSAVGVDPAGRSVMVSRRAKGGRDSTSEVNGGADVVVDAGPSDGGDDTFQLRCDALVVATGIRTRFELFNSPTTVTDSVDARLGQYADFAAKLRTASSIVIAGAGPTGVEFAGEVAEAMARARAERPSSSSSGGARPAEVTLVTGSEHVLNRYGHVGMSITAEEQLQGLGVKVVNHARVVNVDRDEAGNGVHIRLDNGTAIEADMYVDCTGAIPNTSALPQAWLVPESSPDRLRPHAVATDPHTLRVASTSPEWPVFAVGDVLAHSPGGMLAVRSSVPAAMSHLAADLLGSEMVKARASADGWPAGSKKAPKLELFYPDALIPRSTVLVPVGKCRGVGLLVGIKAPSWMVSMVKGKSYMLSSAPGVVKG